MKFSSKHPILIYAVAALLGFYSGLHPTPWLTIPLIPFLFLGWKRVILCSMTFIALFFYQSYCYPAIDIPDTGIQGKFIFTPSSVSKTQSTFGSQWIYQGAAVIKKDKVPCQLRIPNKKEISRPIADKTYLIEGTLKPSYGFRYAVHLDQEKPWIPISGSTSYAEWRYRSKQWVKEYVNRRYQSLQSAEFLGGILTGDFEDQMIKKAFGRAGLQHILAISGFHFTILTSVLILLLRLVFPPKLALNMLLILLCSYFVFLGCGASILRAWMMSLISIIGLLCRRTPIALNSLGFAIFIILAIDPALTLSIGFIFSFAVTASILLFYPLAYEWINKIFSSRNYYQIKQMSYWDQHAYVVNTLAKNMIALSIAVNLCAIPLTLYFFGKFPLISLIYNLIVPFLVSVVMFLFILGIFIPWLHPLNNILTQFTLDCVHHLPAPLHMHLRYPLNLTILLTWLTLLAVVGIYGWTKTKNRFEFTY